MGYQGCYRPKQKDDILGKVPPLNSLDPSLWQREAGRDFIIGGLSIILSLFEKHNYIA